MGTDSCRKIEQARCRKGPACPVLAIQAGTGVEECVQFARDRCFHGLAVADPGVAAVDKCVAAIEQASSCDTVVDPSGSAACAFLSSPAASGDDAGAEVGTGTGLDAATEASADGNNDGS